MKRYLSCQPNTGKMSLEIILLLNGAQHSSIGHLQLGQLDADMALLIVQVLPQIEASGLKLSKGIFFITE